MHLFVTKRPFSKISSWVNISCVAACMLKVFAGVFCQTVSFFIYENVASFLPSRLLKIWQQCYFTSLLKCFAFNHSRSLAQNIPSACTEPDPWWHFCSAVIKTFIADPTEVRRVTEGVAYLSFELSPSVPLLFFLILPLSLLSGWTGEKMTSAQESLFSWSPADIFVKGQMLQMMFFLFFT